jgi:GT2 family glycosyltransferase
MNKKLPGITVLTPSYNDKAKVYRLLDSIKQTKYPKLEVIVIVGGDENTMTEGPKKYPWVKWVDSHTAVDVGQTGRYNLGFAHANPKNHILFCDSDVVIEKDMIHKLVQKLESSKKIGIVTPMILYLNDHNWVNQAGAHVDLLTGKVKVGWGPKEDYLEAKQVQNSGTTMIFKRSLVDKIGCFEDWYMCYFDPDYCVRAIKAGFQVWYEPSAVCYHDQSKDQAVWGPRVLSRAWLLGKNRTLFMKKHGQHMLVYTLFLIPLFGYYLLECMKYNIMPKWWELIQGTIVGYFTPVNKDIYIPIPQVAKK